MHTHKNCICNLFFPVGNIKAHSSRMRGLLIFGACVVYTLALFGVTLVSQGLVMALKITIGGKNKEDEDIKIIYRPLKLIPSDPAIVKMIHRPTLMHGSV